MKTFGYIVIALASFVATPAFASTITLSPTAMSVAMGQTVSVTVGVDAGQADAVTAKAAITYPVDILEAVSFSFAPIWIQLSQPGYDSMTGGLVIKTAGYPGGFTGVKTFGTLVFKAKKAGMATVAVSSGDSAVWSGQGGSSMSGAQGASAITITGGASPTPAAPTPRKIAPIVSVPAGEVVSASEPTEEGEIGSPITILPAPAETQTEEGTVGAQLAAAGAVNTDSFTIAGWAWGIGLGVLAVIGLAWFAYRRFSRSSAK